MKHNRLEIIRVNDVTLAVQNVLRKTFGDEYLKQVRKIPVKSPSVTKHSGSYIARNQVGAKTKISEVF